MNTTLMPLRSAIQILLLGTSLTVGNVFRAGTKVRNEEDLRSHVYCELNPAVEDVLAQLGVTGDLESPGGDYKALVGDPDVSYISTGRERHPRLVVRMVFMCFLDVV
jgi:hypothetical protein